MKFTEEDIMYAFTRSSIGSRDVLLDWIKEGGETALVAVAILINPDILNTGMSKDIIKNTVHSECQTVADELDKSKREIIYKLSQIVTGNNFKAPSTRQHFRKFST